MTVDEITSYSSLEEGDKHNDIGSFENKQIPSEIEGFKVREMEKWNLQIGIFSGIHFDRLISFRVKYQVLDDFITKCSRTVWNSGDFIDWIRRRLHNHEHG